MRQRTTDTETAGQAAIVAAQDAEPPVQTTEIRDLTAAAGYRVVGECTQSRPPDPGTHLGTGKVAELATKVEETGATLVVVDGELTPTQTTTLRDRLPDGVSVFDRYRLILEIFGDQARSNRAQHQVELARLRYELPRIRESADESALNRRTEKGTPVYDVRDRIDRLETKLAELPSPAAQYREQRRDEGFDLVTLAGYTNAGKSTLLHRLADDLSVAETEPEHADLDGSATVEDRLFKTLETTTRRATIGDRPTLVTDTVGFVSDLPHWLVRSFSETLSEAGAADVVVLVLDASDPIDAFREKLEVSASVLDAQGVEREDVVAAVNKIDRCEGAALDRRRKLVSESAATVVPVSTLQGTNIDRLVDAIGDGLPTRRETLTVPNGGPTMELLSWLYDHANVRAVDYGAESVEISVEGRPATVEKARARSAKIGSDGDA